MGDSHSGYLFLAKNKIATFSFKIQWYEDFHCSVVDEPCQYTTTIKTKKDTNNSVMFLTEKEMKAFSSLQ